MCSCANRGFEIQDRDIAILRTLFESRVMTLKHVATLFFSGREHATRKRLQILKSAGLVAERPRKTFDRAVLYLTRAAFRLLRDRGVLNDYPPLTISAHEARARVSDITFRHELEVMDVKASLCAAIAKSDNATVVDFITWPQLIQFECSSYGAPALVKPDGFIRIKTRNAALESVRSFYLELDRSTEKQSVLIHRAICYLAHFKSGGFAVNNGVRRSDFRANPFRVLFVLKSAERRNNIAEALLNNNPSILTFVWLTTFDEITHNPLGMIWIRPVDYRNALQSMPHEVTRKPSARGYRRNRKREGLIENAVRKCQLLASFPTYSTSPLVNR